MLLAFETQKCVSVHNSTSTFKSCFYIEWDFNSYLYIFRREFFWNPSFCDTVIWSGVLCHYAENIAALIYFYWHKAGKYLQYAVINGTFFHHHKLRHPRLFLSTPLIRFMSVLSSDQFGLKGLDALHKTHVP